LPRANSSPPNKFKKKTVLSKCGRSGALLGINFQSVFLLVYGHLRAAGVPIARAAVTSIGQQNPTRTPKIVGFARKKQAKIPIFDFAKKDRILRCTFCVLVCSSSSIDYT
jgi:hypothetical protein